MPWIGLVPLLLGRFKRVKYLEIALPVGSIDNQKMKDTLCREDVAEDGEAGQTA